MDEATWEACVSRAEKCGYDVSKLTRVEHDRDMKKTEAAAGGLGAEEPAAPGGLSAEEPAAAEAPGPLAAEEPPQAAVVS